MIFKIILKTSTCITIELANTEVYYNPYIYDVYLDDNLILTKQATNVISLYNLTPSQEYEMKLSFQGGGISIQKFQTESEVICLNVKRFNAKGDGGTDDTLAIQAAIMSCPPKGRVFIPAGDYLINTVFLKSDITLEITKGAKLSFAGQFYKGAVLPGYLTQTDGDEYYLGSWEGNPLDTLSALIQGINIHNVNIIGEGILEGNGYKYWDHTREKRGGFRPRLVQFIHSKNIVMQGLTVQNSPSWTIHPLFSDCLLFADLKIRNPKNSPNTDGLNPESCQNVEIVGVHFSVGDDCIALKSGKIYLGSRLKKPTEFVNIRNCSMNYGHGAIVVGSEMAGGVKNITVTQCLFNETDRGLRIKTRRGRGKDAIIDNIHFKNIKMERVLAPLTINTLYFCDPDGHSEYVQSREKLVVDERTPYIGKIIFEDIVSSNSEWVAGYFYGLPEQPIEEVVLKNCEFSIAEKASAGYPIMMDNIDLHSRAGLIFNHIKVITIENVLLSGVVGQNYTFNYVNEIVDR